MRWLILLATLMGCSEADGIHPLDTDHASSGLPDVYAFESRADGMDSVSYSGQVFRQILISDLKAHLGDVSGRIERGDIFPVAGDIADELDFYLTFDSSVAGGISTLYETSPPPAQDVYDDLSTGKDLLGKLAGNDEVGQHIDWSTGLIGWETSGIASPEQLVYHWVDRIDQQALDISSGHAPLAPDGTPISTVYVTPEGHDLQQLLEKFLRGAVSFSQGADDYLDDDLSGKGLLSDHTAVEDGKNYTALEHAWDEGFGYFGAARSYGGWTDDEIADIGAIDANGDGDIDLTSEACFGHSINAAKRDRGSQSSTPTDFTASAWEGFVRGRQLIANADGPLSAAELERLRRWRDQAVGAWEMAISSTVIHYINDVLQDMNAMDTADYSFADHAKHWSEMKGFALSLQFNPHSPLSANELATLHDLLGTQPVLATHSSTERLEYASDLLEARAMLTHAYGFSTANIGDELGKDGW